MSKMDDVKCPHCQHVFNASETFVWDIDEDNDPTIEYLRCPKCGISTVPMMACEHCPGYFDGKYKCNLDGLCAAASFVSFDDFEVVSRTS